MPWLWRIIAALLAFFVASITAYIEHSLGDTVAWIWRLAGVGLILAAAVAGSAMLVSGWVVLAQSRAASRQ